MLYDYYLFLLHQYLKRNQSMIKIGNFEMLQSLDFPLTKKDTLTISGKLSTSDRFGAGSISASLRRLLSSDTYLDVSKLSSILCRTMIDENLIWEIGIFISSLKEHWAPIRIIRWLLSNDWAKNCTTKNNKINKKKKTITTTTTTT